MTVRLRCCLGLLAAVFGVQDLLHASAVELILEQFGKEPNDALVRRLLSDEGPVAESLVQGVTQIYRFVPDPGFLLMDATLTAHDRRATEVHAVPVLNWTFRAFGGPDAPGYRDLSYRQDNWYGSTYWTGPNWTRVGKDWHHPGTDTPSVRRFVAPQDGHVTVSGRVYKAHLDGDGVRACIRHGKRTVWTADIAGKDEVGHQISIALDVRRGDSIRFVIHKLGSINCDTTRWDPVITYADGKQYRASQGFSTSKQGQGGWFYEMEVNPSDASGLPHVYGLTRDLGLRVNTLEPGKALVLDGREFMPLAIVADETDHSGIVLALNSPGVWQLTTVLTVDGQLHLSLRVGDHQARLYPEPGHSVPLPRIAVGAYGGTWLEGAARLQHLARSAGDKLGMTGLRKCLAATGSTDLDLLMMVLDEWYHEDKLDGSTQSYSKAVTRHLEKAALLLADLRQGRSAHFLAAEARTLDQLSTQVADTDLALKEQQSLYWCIRHLKRKIALASPLMQFGKLLFCKRVPTSYSHLVMQYYGWRARPGGGLFVLDRPGRSLSCHDITAGQLHHGNVLEPCLSYDGKSIVFSYVKCGDRPYDPAQVSNTSGGGYYHVWEVKVNGSGLRQLTDGDFDDLMPAYLPDGGIAFSSTRRRGYARCFGSQFSHRWDIYTLHRMDGNGQHIRLLSCHDTNEWFPTVTNDGRLLYARWDYIDRDAVTHQNLWATHPDGTNTATVWGNATPSPHCSFQAKPIPDTGKFVFTASAHHSITAGSIVVVNPSLGYDGEQALTRITPEIPFPEAESRDITEYYSAPWPLSAKYFLVGYSRQPLVWEPEANPRNALGIYLLDIFGNRELIYRDPEIGSTNPIPLTPRPAPPVLASELRADAPPTGEILLLDVYRGLGDVPRGTVKQLRIIQVFPKTTPWANDPRMGVAGEENGRAILGTVPVYPDGSARFRVPAMKPLLFQALDEDGFALQTMRSVAYVQPGEQLSCVGCHENRLTAPPPTKALALRCDPSVIDPGPLGGRPFSFVEMVQPILDRHCVACHGGMETQGDIDLSASAEGPWTKSYASLTANAALVPRFAQRNQIQVTPVGGRFGARGSGLMELLRAGHEGVKLSKNEMGCLAAWIDCNAIFYGTPDPADQARQRCGEVVGMPAVQ